MKTKLIYSMGCMVLVSPIYAKIPSFVGDLVGRDLAGVGSVLGHVGIATAPYYKMRPTTILEALDSFPHIQENSITDFKSRSKYWGSKGGLLSPQSIESYTVVNRIVRQYYACPEYTITWRWREGKIDSNSNPLLCGIFRCDTLVNYAYAFSKGYSLPTYDTTWTTPLAVYNYFPVESDLFDYFQPISMRSNAPLLLDTKNLISENINSINKKNIKELDEKSLYSMLQNSTSISKEQISSLWRLFTLKEIDNDVKILFYDYISFENPSYLTTEVIKQAKIESNEARHKLLVVLQSIYQNKLKNNEKSDLNEIIQYFKELSSQNLNKNDAGIVYRGLAILAPEYLNIKKTNLTNMDKIHIDIFNIKNDPSNELKYVKDIINNLESPDDRLVVSASYKYLTQLLINSELKFFSEESKELFREHLNKKNMINLNQTLVYTPAYIEFKAVLNARESNAISPLAYEYMQPLDSNIQNAILHDLTDLNKNPL